MKHILNIVTIFLVVRISICITSCSGFVSAGEPKLQFSRAKVFSNASTANAAEMAIYSQMITTGFTVSNMAIPLGLSADELTDYTNQSPNFELYKNSILPNNSTVASTWSNIYQFIYMANAVIEGVKSSGINKDISNQLTGEARFSRAFLYFQLVNLFGAVPLVVSTDPQLNLKSPRTTSDSIYSFIISELEAAKELIADNYVSSDGLTQSNERVRPNKKSVCALLARVYLYKKDYENAKRSAEEVIGDSRYQLTATDSTFLKNSNEAIWQLTAGSSFNTLEGAYFVFSGYPYSQALSPNLVSAFSPTDLRLKNWIGATFSGPQEFYYPYKYKQVFNPVVSEYVMVLRLAEQILIKAECEYFQNDYLSAVADIDLIRLRAGLSKFSFINTSEILTEIINQRKKELFTEWGHRWFDLKRLGIIGTIMQQVSIDKGGTWADYRQMFPIPQVEIQNNNNLIQNDGY